MQQEMGRLGGQLQELHGRMEQHQGQLGEIVASEINTWAATNGMDINSIRDFKQNTRENMVRALDWCQNLEERLLQLEKVNTHQDQDIVGMKSAEQDLEAVVSGQSDALIELEETVEKLTSTTLPEL